MKEAKAAQIGGFLVTAVYGDVWLGGYMVTPGEARRLAEVLLMAANEALAQRKEAANVQT